MSQTYVKNKQTRQVGQPQHSAQIVALTVKTQPVSHAHEPIVIFSREWLPKQQ